MTFYYYETIIPKIITEHDIALVFFFYNIYDTCTLWLYDNWALLNYIQALHEQFLDLNGDY